MSRWKRNGIKEIIDEMTKANYIVPQDYELQFNQARLTFKYQLVYWPKREKIVHLNEPEEDLERFLRLNKSRIDTPSKWNLQNIGK